MTKEQIKNEAAEYAKGKYGGKNAEMWSIAQIHAGRDGFVAGADWRINSVWHKPEEVPEADRDIIVKSYKEYQTWVLSKYLLPDWKDLLEDYKVTCWAYIDDLIPTEDERDS